MAPEYVLYGKIPDNCVKICGKSGGIKVLPVLVGEAPELFVGYCRSQGKIS